MVNRLAELLVRTNHQIRGLLRAAYPFVFVDEFQDTTYAQFDLLETAFHGSTSAVTAVGDDKQRIMVWAGARPDAFARFAERFGAVPYELVFNYRSSPELVRLQHAIARAIDDSVLSAESRVAAQVDNEAAVIWSFPSLEAEAARLAAWIHVDRIGRGLAPHDYAIVARQRVDRVYSRLVGPFADVGLRLRNESLQVGGLTIQDVMAEPLTDMALAVLEVAVRPPAPEAWITTARAVRELRAVAPDDEVGLARVDQEVTAFVRELRADLHLRPVSREAARTLGQRVIDFLSLNGLAQTVPEYAVGDSLELAAESLLVYLGVTAEGATSWADCTTRWRGIGEIPLLTIHKSKGLEYDTVVFVDLDDLGWPYHRRGNREGLATFFVALSRARQRVIFAHCQQRGRGNVSDLYDLLARAGVPEREW
jgi:superfamily I DNA/RNA helicase